MESGKNQRRHKRYAIAQKILISDTLELRNLSESGVLVSSIHPLSKGKQINLSLQLDETVMELRATVRWCKESASIFRSGFSAGMEFDTPSIQSILAIRRYLEAIE
jgi:hypothetical protein